MPIDLQRFHELRAARIGYLGPAIAVAALVLALPLHRLEPRGIRASIGKLRGDLARAPERLTIVLLALFGLIAFRTALGRSDLAHIDVTFAVPAILICVALDRTVALFAAGPEVRRLALWRSGGLILVVVLAGLLDYQGRDAVKSVRRSLRSAQHLMAGEYRPRGSPELRRVRDWIHANSEPSDPVWFLPNDAAYYYLVERPNPTRFVVSHQIVTDAHRDEVLQDLRRNPPRYVVWNERGVRVDEIPDRMVLGAPLYDWLEQNYSLAVGLGSVLVMEHRGAGAESP
jgi:hypothetical protein